MDLKDLNNYQLVLLTLLVSFVTSIATGIITVYLLQSSPTVSSVINQVIQKTVETVVPEGQNQVQKIITNNQVVFVKESDLVPVVVDTIKKSLITIKYNCEYGEAEIAAGAMCPTSDYGIITNADGQFLTAKKLNPGISSAGIFPANASKFWFAFSHVTVAENGFTYDNINFPEGKRIPMPHVMAFTKALPTEGETLVLYDPNTSSVKKIYADKIDTANKKFTVNYPLAGFAGLPIVNLDGEVAGIVYDNAGAPTVLSSLEFADLKFKEASLTSN